MAGNFLKILFVSAEVSPYAKVGGLADVAGSLPKALANAGHQVTVAMPAYQMILDDPRWTIETAIEHLPVTINADWTVDAWVKEVWMGDVRVLLIGGEDFFTGANSSEHIYLPGVEQYIFWSHAVLLASKKLGLNPNVVHCNDWQTGLIPVLMREKYAAAWSQVAALYTIHNLAYQGEFDRSILDQAELSQKLFVPEKLETWGRFNFLKAGCVYSDQVTTVSPTYAQEIKLPRYGCTLEGLMQHLDEQGRLTGILNGLDLEFFNPATDPALPTAYDLEDLSGKVTCKARLQSELGLPVKPGVPLMGIVSRLSHQKGLDLVLEIASRLHALPGQLVVQGLGDPWIAGQLQQLTERFAENICFAPRFDADLAQRIYAGADMFLMPSAFEPCGLGQMIAMRYGTVPIVRKTGGLADTVFEGKNGFVFDQSDPGQLWAALERASEEFQVISDWGHFVKAGMSMDFSWDSSASEYVDVYHKAMAGRAVQSAAAAS
ncbi:MAG: glycogen synthase [Fimbriimonadaceae bacterium]|nr:glycogen synthase [Fimbriimonadaceae bacterium]